MSERPHTNRIFFAGFILVLLGALIYLFQSYLLTLSIGILLAISTMGLQNFSLKITKNRELLASILTISILIGLFCLPFIYIFLVVFGYISNMDYEMISGVFNKIKAYRLELPDALAFMQPRIDEFIASLDLGAIIKKGAEYLSLSVGKSANFAVDMSFIAIFVFFTHYYASSLGEYIKKVAPIATTELKEIFKEVANTMSVVFYSTLANMILQGVLFAFIASFYGYDGVLFGVLFGFASLIPIVGGALVFVPVALYQYGSGDLVGAIVIVVYTCVVISTLADNFAKPLIIKFINSKLLDTPAKVNELLIFFAMIAGLSSFGFWGIILGPAIVTLFIAALRVYAKR